LTDPEIRVRLRNLRMGDPHGFGAMSFSVGMMAILYSIDGTRTDFGHLLAYLLLAVGPGDMIVRHRRWKVESREEPERLRRSYEAALGQTIESLRRVPEALAWCVGGVGVAVACVMVLCGSANVIIGSGASLLSILLAAQLIHRRREVLPRIEWEQAILLGTAPA
jgi:hypothetical protein